MRQCTTLVLVAATLGCGGRRGSPPPTELAPKPAETVPAARFDPATAGTVRGRVAWAGAMPDVPPLQAAVPDGTSYRFATMPNPFAPAVTAGGMGGVVVSLRGVDPARSKPWPFPPATVEQAGHVLKVWQGDGPPAAVGFARAGDEVRVVSRDPGPATIRLRGAAFVTLPFPGPDKPLARRFEKPGAVEITSGTMLAWAAADLIVCDHPYHAVTAAAGTFALTDVPAGEYTLVCRVRNWRLTGQDRDPETGLVSRRRFAPPVELTATVQVAGRCGDEHTFVLDETVFR